MNSSIKIYNSVKIIFMMIFIFQFNNVSPQDLVPVVPDSLRGDSDFERLGQHDANNIRTRFWNYGMVGDYPRDPINVDLTVFHSMEWPNGSMENYSDGHTPYVLAKIEQRNGREAYIMETGFRERQAQSPFDPTKTMRYEPRPGYFQISEAINVNKSPAMSHDPRTWPDFWIDKLDDPDDPGWSGSWNGYFGKAIVADQESFVVYDDNYYNAWDFQPDSRDPSRKGLGLRVEQRGFQWANPQAGNVIFWHYDITNEGTTNYRDNIIFGIYLDSGIGGSGVGLDGIPESDDDNASFQKTVGLNVVYTWDKFGRGTIGPTGYLGYSYLETPGNPFDLEDNDLNGITDEVRDGGPGTKIEGQDAIRNYFESNYNTANFEQFYGKLESMPAYQEGVWWTGDEDMDWVAEFHDTGADGIFANEDTPPDNGEKDGKPTEGEANFDRTDIDESDQIGLTGFKMNRIRAGAGAPEGEVDGIVFFTNTEQWPMRLYDKFISDDPFDQALVLNYNIGFLFASGPFRLEAGKTERFSLAQGFGANLRELENTLRVVSQIYKANYQFAVPPPTPTVKVYSGDGFVTLYWDDKAERGFDPITLKNDFEGYRVYRSTDPTFLDPQVIFTGTGSQPIGNGKPIAQFDLIDDIYGFSTITVEGVAYFLGDETGLTHTLTDSTVTNGQLYYYAVTAYDTGEDSLYKVYPSENSISVSQTLRGGVILAKNVVEVRPNVPAKGYEPAKILELDHTEGEGTGNVVIQIVNSELIPDGHEYKVDFVNLGNNVKADFYRLIDVTTQDTLFKSGKDFGGFGVGPVASGILPIINTPETIQIDSVESGFTDNSSTNAALGFQYNNSGLPINLKREAFPADIKIIFSDSFIDTSLGSLLSPGIPTNFRPMALTDAGEKNLNFFFTDANKNGLLDDLQDVIQIVTYADENPSQPVVTWRIKLDTTGQSQRGTLDPPGEGDEYYLALNVPFSSEDEFTFIVQGQKIDLEKLQNDESEPYVVPNPYVGAASFEPQRFAVSGRGERRIEFRNLPPNSTLRIYTVTGELVNTLNHEGDITKGIIPWNLRSKDNLEVAPGLYFYSVESSDTEAFIGKFAIIK